MEPFLFLLFILGCALFVVIGGAWCMVEELVEIAREHWRVK